MRLALLAGALAQPDLDAVPAQSREARMVLAGARFGAPSSLAHLRADLACPLQHPVCDLRGPDGDVIPCRDEALSLYQYAKWIPTTARVLEVGARFGQATCTLQRLVGGGGSLVAVEPDVDRWTALGRNLKANGCEARVVRQIRAELDAGAQLSLAATTTPAEIASVSGAEFTALGDFDTLAVDCVGCFAQFFDDNRALFHDGPLRRIIVRRVEESAVDEQLALRDLVENGWSVAEGVPAVTEDGQRVIPSMVLCRPHCAPADDQCLRPLL